MLNLNLEHNAYLKKFPLKFEILKKKNPKTPKFQKILIFKGTKYDIPKLYNNTLILLKNKQKKNPYSIDKQIILNIKY